MIVIWGPLFGLAGLILLWLGHTNAKKKLNKMLNIVFGFS